MLPIFINTRPASCHALYLSLVQIAEVIRLPLLKLRQKPLSSEELGSAKGLLSGRYRLVVAVSMSACQEALAYYTVDERALLKALNHSGRLDFVAVGQATADFLRMHGFLVLQPDEASNESMTQMPYMQQLPIGAGVLFWRGLGGRTLLAEFLQTRGVEVAAIAWYERHCPDDLLPKIQALLRNYDGFAQCRVFVLISSLTAWQHWQAGIDGLNFMPKQLHYLTLGKRLYAAISPHADSICVPNLQENELYFAINQLSDAHD